MVEGIAARRCVECGAVSPVHSAACTRCSAPFPVPYRQSTSPFPRGSRVRALAWVAVVILVVFWLTVGSLLSAMLSRVLSSGAYKQALALAHASTELQSILGPDFAPHYPVLGFLSSRHSQQFAVFSIPVAGSRGTGHLYAVGNSINGAWEFSRLSFVSDTEQRTFDLAPVSLLQNLPAVPEQTVFLLPIGLDASESLDWAAAYYKSKFQLDVQILPAIPMEPSLVDSRRRQVDSEKFMDFAIRKYPEIARDPSHIFIGVTSRDMFIRSFDWAYAINFRHHARFAMLSSARLRPSPFLNRWNPEWQHSRVQKMLTKNIAMLYFGFPMSSDETSLLSGGIVTGSDVDVMSGSIIGSENRWDPLLESGDLGTTIYDVPGKPLLWRNVSSGEAMPGPSTAVYATYLTLGLFSLRESDVRLDGEFALPFTRVYRNQDPASRPFGVGANDSLDIFLVGQMGSYCDLILEDGGRVHFTHSSPRLGLAGDTYVSGSYNGEFSNTVADYAGGIWTLTRADGWKFFFPYRPTALGQNVTVLTGFQDSAGRLYRMERDSSGDLLSITTPSGQWIHFQNDASHRIRRLEASTGRIVRYEYDEKGCLSRVEDSEGHLETYTYDDQSEMTTIAHGSDEPVLRNSYEGGNIRHQIMADGRTFDYHYARNSSTKKNAPVPDLVTDPNRKLTYIRCGSNGCVRSLPVPPAH